jgi:hypothetical protein
MQAIPLSKQDELCFEAMTDETKSLIYYGLAALTVDVDRNTSYTEQFSNAPQMGAFYSNIKVGAIERMEFLRKQFPCGDLSLIKHFAPQD